MRTSALLIASLAAALALVTVGCGASTTQKQADAWASSVCSSISNWHYEVDAVATDFGSGISRDSFRTKIAQLAAATGDMVKAVKGATLPDTPEGRSALAGMRGLVDGWSKEIAAVRAKGRVLLASKRQTVVQSGLSSITLVLRSLSLRVAAGVDGVRAGASGPPAKALAQAKDCIRLKTELS